MKFSNRQQYLTVLNTMVRSGWNITDIEQRLEGLILRVYLKSESTQLRYVLEHHRSTETFGKSDLEEYRRERTFTTPEH